MTSISQKSVVKFGLGILIATMLIMLLDVYEGITGRDDILSIPDNLSFLEELVEIGLVFGLGVFTFYLFHQLRQSARRDESREQTLSLLRGKFGEVLGEKFAHWGLTEAERDVTMLMLKGLRVAEIAAVRHTASGTVKAQSTAIFRKAGVTSKSVLLSTIIDEFLDQSDPSPDPRGADGLDPVRSHGADAEAPIVSSSR